MLHTRLLTTHTATPGLAARIDQNKHGGTGRLADSEHLASAPDITTRFEEHGAE